MANSSVIDSLVVTLGLSADGFTKGMASAGESLVGFTAKLAGMFFAVRGIEDLVGHFKDLSQSLFHLGIDARNLDVAGTRLSQWGEVARLAGGRAEDATATIAGLNQAIFGLKYQGELSGPLMQLMRFGINPFRRGPSGEVLPREDDHALWMEESIRAMQLEPNSQAMRYELLKSFGLQGGIASAAAQGPEKLAEYFKTAAEDQKSLTEQAIDHQIELNQHVISLQSDLNANSAKLLDQFTPFADEVVKDLRLLVAPMQFLSDLFSGKSKNPAVQALGLGGEWLGRTAADLMDYFNGTGQPRNIRNNNPLNLVATGNQERDAQGFAIFPDADAGLFATERQLKLDASRGINTIRALVEKYVPRSVRGNNTDNEMAFIAAQMHLSTNDVLSASNYPAFIAAMSAFESGRGRPGAIAVGSIPRSAPVTPTASRATVDFLASERARNATQVQIDNMTINTQATDANGIATDLMAALGRKTLVSTLQPSQQ